MITRCNGTMSLTRERGFGMRAISLFRGISLLTLASLAPFALAQANVVALLWTQDITTPTYAARFRVDPPQPAQPQPLDAVTNVSCDGLRYDRANQEATVNVSITNTSDEPIVGMLRLAVTGLPETVSLMQDGTMSSGTPYVDFTNYLVEGQLLPGHTVMRRVSFHNPNCIRFQPIWSVWGKPPVSVTASASPTNGPIPLIVAFSASIIGDVVHYEWDFETDGIYDWSSSITPSTTHTYPAIGTFTATIRVTDAGNWSATDSIVISTESALEARPSASPTSGPAPLTVSFITDGHDPVGTIQVFRWDFQGDGAWDTYDTVARDYVYTYSTAGTYNATLYVESSTGATDTASVTITVTNNPPTATADVVPSNGPVPLAVQLLGTGTDLDGYITLYEWDRDGDGVFDWSSPTESNTSYTYTDPGTYQAVFRVTDDKLASATAMAVTTVVQAGPPGSPTVAASANPATGPAPLVVNFTCTASDPDNDIVLYEWDFDNDGVFDWSSSSSCSTAHTYTQAGTQVAALRVTDATSLTATDHVVIVVVLTTSLSISNNTVGFLDEDLFVNHCRDPGVVATASSEHSPSYAAAFAIDGVQETYWVSEVNDTPGQGAGTFLEVTFPSPRRVAQVNLRGGSWWVSYGITRGRIKLFDAADALLCVVEQNFDSSNATVLLTETENVTRCRLTALAASPEPYCCMDEFEVGYIPDIGGDPVGTDVNTTISASTRVSVFIRDAAGQTARTLVNSEYREMGSYSDYWDCRNDDGFLVNDGLYYAVLAYEFDGAWHELDLTHTTGGTRHSFPFGSGCDQRDTFPNGFTFSPFDDESMALPFRLCTAQEVTAFIGPLWGGADEDRFRTIVSRVPFPAGESTIYWDGLNDQGQIAEPLPGDDLITGFWRYDLPDNAIYMTGGKPAVSAVAATENYFSPFSESCTGEGHDAGVIVTYSLSEPAATVELRVYSTESSNLLRTLQVTNIEAGPQSIFWDGKNDNGEYVDIGDYRVGVLATDADGNQSMIRYVLVRVDY